MKNTWPRIDYEHAEAWDCYQKQLSVEYRQSMEEGKDVASLKDLFEAADRLPAGPEKAQIADALFSLVQAAPLRPDFPYREPSDLECIRAERLPGPKLPGTLPDRDSLREKIRGAWYGRIAGCLLGKPIEGMRTDHLHPLLRETGNMPMHRYIRSAELTDALCKEHYLSRDRCWGDRVTVAPDDDDTNYTVLAQQLICQTGRAFTTEDVGKIWISRQPKSAYCTAERVAYLNLLRGLLPPETAAFQNPYREWIGAQIRGDYFGYICPGAPEAAAELAWRDARLSHVKNGIYGEMYVAAMLAAAAVSELPRLVIEAGLSQIPGASRLYHSVRRLLDDFDRGTDAETCFARIHAQYNEHDPHDWCHTIPNALIVTAALLYGDGDYSRSVCLAVQCGFDTDCNGATTGSITGMMKGFGAIDPAWTEPLHGTLKTALAWTPTFSIEELVDQTLAHIS